MELFCQHGEQAGSCSDEFCEREWELMQEVATLEHENTSLKEALRPFAALGELWLTEMGLLTRDDHVPVMAGNSATIGMLRAAAKALKGEP